MRAYGEVVVISLSLMSKGLLWLEQPIPFVKLQLNNKDFIEIIWNFWVIFCAHKVDLFMIVFWRKH